MQTAPNSVEYIWKNSTVAKDIENHGTPYVICIWITVLNSNLKFSCLELNRYQLFMNVQNESMILLAVDPFLEQPSYLLL